MKQRLCGAIATIVATVGMCAGFAGAAPAPSSVLYGVASFAPFSNQSLYLIDPATGAATLVGNTGVANISGIAWNAAEGRMYALSTDASVYTLNLFTGAATFVSDSPNTLPEGDLAVLGSSLLAVDGGNLVSINPGSGVVSPVGPLGAAVNDVSGLAFNAAGTLFGLSKNGTFEDTIVTINPATGLATTLGGVGFDSPSGVGALAYDPDTDVLFMTDSQRLLSVDQTTGAATVIGSHGLGGFSGLAIPAPHALGVLLLGVAAAGRRRR